MISVAELYKIAYLDVAVEQRSSYVTEEEITRAINKAQFCLYNYHRSKGNQRALRPFTKSGIELDVHGEFVVLPPDFEDLSALYVDAVLAGKCAPDIRPVTYKDTTPAGFRKTREDSILKGDFKRGVAWYTYGGGTIMITPAAPKVKMDYYRVPTPAKLALTILANDETGVDLENSVDLEWDATELENMVTLLLAQLGIEQRESVLLQYFQAQETAKQTIQS